MPPIKRTAEPVVALDYVAGDGLILDGADPVLCVAVDGQAVMVRAGKYHPFPMRVPARRVRSATNAEISKHEDVYSAQLASRSTARS